MTEVLYNPKIKPEHLARKAIVYLRQSSEKQVRQNKESQLLQYAVAERVRALGWKQVEIINSDLGSSAGLASAQSGRGASAMSVSVAVPKNRWRTTVAYPMGGRLAETELPLTRDEVGLFRARPGRPKRTGPRRRPKR